MPLPILTPQSRVSAASARHDNIQFTLPLGSFHDPVPLPTREVVGLESISIDEVAEYLGAPPRGTRSENHRDILPMYSCYFTRATGANNERELFVRSEPLNVGGESLLDRVPLCSGLLKLRKSGGGHGRYVSVEYFANVNPTRFVRYQNPSVLRGNYTPSVPPLFSNTLGVPDNEGEISADDSDNWLSDHPAAIWQSFAGNWLQRLTDYLNAVEDGMRGEMTRRGEIPNMTETLTFSPSDESWRLNSVETYWEFQAEPSPEFLIQFDTAMRSYCALEHARREFEGHTGNNTEPRRTRERTGRNGVLFTLLAKPGIRVVAYAKTNQRIRLEVRHNFKSLRPQYGLRRNATSAAEMVHNIQKVSEDAAETLNAFLTHFERIICRSPVPSMPSPTTFLFRVVEHCDSSAAAETIVRLLIMEGAVSRVEPLSKSINRLRKEGILERARNSQRSQSMTYIPSPAYAHAVEYLRRIANPSELTVGRRLRSPRPA